MDVTLSFLGLLAILISSLAFLVRQSLARARSKSALACISIPSPPGAHWLLGHAALVMGPLVSTVEQSDGETTNTETVDHFAHMFVDHANEAGLTAFWMFHRRCLSVLDARHARTILQSVSDRHPIPIVTRHGRKTLGDEGLIFLRGGAEWKKQRSLIAKAFNVKALVEGRPLVLGIARNICCSLSKMCDRERSIAAKKNNEEVNAKRGNSGGVEIDVSILSKMFTIQVFGQVALGVDFRLISDHDDYTAIDMSNYSINNEDDCNEIAGSNFVDADAAKRSHENLRVVKLTTQARALEFLLNDINLRVATSSVLNPCLQFYWIPTRYNREYHKMKNIVKNLMHEIIEEGRSALKVESIGGEMAASSITSNGEKLDDSDKHSTKKRYDNMLTNIIRAHEDVSAENLSKITTTLLFAGYETSSITISYALYNLSQHMRCQERVAEEVWRLFGECRNSNDDARIVEKINEESLRYTYACITESMRLCPTVLQTARDLLKPFDLDGYVIPVGTRVFINLVKLHVDERNFDRPLEFCPERWVRWEDGKWIERDYEVESSDGKDSPSSSRVDNNNNNKHTNDHCHNQGPKSNNPHHQSQNEHAETIPAANPKNFLAFSHGARNCVGKRLAILETTMVIAMIIKDFIVESDASKPFEKKRRLVSWNTETLPLIFKKRIMADWGI